MIYADWAATSGSLASGVQEAVADYLRAPCNPGHSTSAPARQMAFRIWKTRQALGNFFGLKQPERVIFTSGITESLNMAIHSLIHPGDSVITTWLEHNSVLRPLYASGADLTFTDGSLEQIQAAWKPETKAIVLSHVSNVTGQVQDLEAIGKWAREKGILFIVDSAQSAGILDIDMEKMNIDVLAVTGHKGLQALQGIGALLVREGIELEPLKTGGTGVHSFEKTMPAAWPEHLEAGTLNVPGIVSLHVALQALPEDRRQEKEKRLRSLSGYFLDNLQTLPGITLYREPGKDSLGVFSMNIEGKDPAYCADYLEQHYGVCSRTGAHCAPLVLEHYGISSCLRLSFSAENTRHELDTILQGLEELACT